MEAGAVCDDTSQAFTTMQLQKSVTLNPATRDGRRRLSRTFDQNGRRLAGQDNTLCAGVIVNDDGATVG